MEREAAEKARLKAEEEKQQAAAFADLQRRQQSIQNNLVKQEEKWERVKLPPPPPQPISNPSPLQPQPRSVLCCSSFLFFSSDTSPSLST
jgi:hypothetical protein